MPSFKKRALSLYLRNQCERQFALYLYNDAERAQHGMPSRQQNRSGLTYVGRAGYEWQDEKISEIRDLFGEERVYEGPRNRQGRPGSIPLIDVLPSANPYQFVVEGAYEADTPTFRQSIGINNLNDYYGDRVEIGDTRPDVIQILPSVNQMAVLPTNQTPDPYQLQVLPNGDLVPLPMDDARLRLRVIDIKLTSEPGAQYFAEVIYYSISLAAWLIERGFDSRYVVIGAPAVWPGRHDASALSRHRDEWQRRAHNPTELELFGALEEDIEVAIFDIYAPRVKQLLVEDFPSILARQWDELPWHVDHRCKGCEFLGYPWSTQDIQDTEHARRCWSTAERERNLSRVYGLSRGASEQLRSNNILNIDELAVTEASSSVFNIHQSLRVKRNTFPSRALALQAGRISIVPNSGGDALMPSWPSLHIYIFLDYDLSSAFTATMAIRAFWREPLPFNSSLTPQQRQWTHRQGEDEIFLVDARNLEHERREFLRFLRQLSRILRETRTQDDADVNSGRRANGNRSVRSTYQIYIWDEAQRKQIIRMVGRHLQHILADTTLHELVWLFPPPELLQQAEEATRKSAITLVKTVVDNTIALDVPHYYRLLDLAERVTPENLPRPSVHPLYAEPMSDLIPMERLHEYWSRSTNWLERQEHIIDATRAKVYGLSLTVGWLEQQLRQVLSRQAAPPVFSPKRRVAGLAPVNHLLLGFTQLNAALSSLETVTIRSMPPYEREARLKSARLERRLRGQEKLRGIGLLNGASGTNLTDARSLWVYQLREGSCDVNIKPGEFLVALAPEEIHGFLDQKAYSVTSNTPYMQNSHHQQTIEEARLTAATVMAIDRVNALIALRIENADLLDLWESSNRFNFSQNVVLDPIYQDFLTDKIRLTLQGIGNPMSASNVQVSLALHPSIGNARSTAETPASSVLWNAVNVHRQLVPRDIQMLRQRLNSYLINQSATLDDSQWAAWEEALTHGLALIWGPPGTGKSRTLRAIVLGAILDANARRSPLRLLITANTYNAIDNVLLPLEGELRTLVGSNYHLFRIQSKSRENTPADWAQRYPTLNGLVLNRARPSAEILQLRGRLESPTEVLIVGCTPEQLHNLAIAPQSNSQIQPRTLNKAWFDMIVLDEASQMDVATSTLVFTKRTSDGACVLAGDNLQLPPIHQADPPEGLDTIVGSIYSFFRYYHNIEPRSLDINYRSNTSITEFTKKAGYSQSLRSFSPDLRLSFSNSLGFNTPSDWPNELFWTSSWQEFLDPAFPTVSFIYQDTLSSQVNQFEADTIASLLWILRKTLTIQLLNERQVNGSFLSMSNNLYEAEGFWGKAVGIVTPHKAQMSKVISRLRQIFPQDPAASIYGTVDTVERYQGQQRDVIIASFGIGDPDLIRGEDEFLYSLNRFNVLVSRARAKVIVLLTQSMLQYLSNDIGVLKESRLLKQFAESYCTDSQQIELGYIRNGVVENRRGSLKRS